MAETNIASADAEGTCTLFATQRASWTSADIGVSQIELSVHRLRVLLRYALTKILLFLLKLQTAWLEVLIVAYGYFTVPEELPICCQPTLINKYEMK